MDSNSISTLGLFGRLPQELRQEIWCYFIPQVLPTNRSHLNILLLNRRIHNEFLEIYETQQTDTVKITISPKFPNTSGITMRYLKNLEQEIADLSDSFLRGLMTNFCTNCKPVRAILLAPDPEDPGQLFLMWQRVCRVISILDGLTTHRHLEVEFRNTAEGQWFSSNGKTQRSITADPGQAPQFTDFYQDFDVVLNPFARLPGFKYIGIRLPKGYVFSDDSTVLPFPLAIREFELSQDNDTLNFENVDAMADKLELLLHRALDNLPGPTAAMLRLERFASWYEPNSLNGESTYERRLEKITRDLQGQDRDHLYSIDYRYKMMWTMSPISRNHKGWNKQLWYQTYPQGFLPMDDFHSRLNYIKNSDSPLQDLREPSLFDRLYPMMRKAQPEDQDNDTMQHEYYTDRKHCLENYQCDHYCSICLKIHHRMLKDSSLRRHRHDRVGGARGHFCEVCAPERDLPYDITPREMERFAQMKSTVEWKKLSCGLMVCDP